MEKIDKNGDDSSLKEISEPKEKTEETSIKEPEIVETQSKEKENTPPEEQKNGILKNIRLMIRDGIKNFISNHKIFFTLFVISSPFILFLTRAIWQPYVFLFKANVMHLISYSFIVLIISILPALLFSWIFNIPLAMFKKSLSKKQRMKFFLPLTFTALIALSVYTSYCQNFNPAEYIRHYICYRSLNIEEISTPPNTTSKYDRVLPRHGIYSWIKSLTEENLYVTIPDYVKHVNNDYVWATGVEPLYKGNRFFGNIRKLIVISGNDLSPSLKANNQIEVNFACGENLFLGKNIYTNARKKLTWNFFSSEPVDLKYIQNENGDWVQIVTFVKYEGFFFPTPTFGGLVVIEQENHAYENNLPTETIGEKIIFFWDYLYNNVFNNLKGTVNFIVFGKGTFISPKDVGNYAYLKNQNIRPEKVSRYIGSSLRYTEGFFAPLPGWHKGDIRIPDFLHNGNDQPFTQHVFLDDQSIPTGLYATFILEPFRSDLNSYVRSLYLPADCQGEIYSYKHNSEKNGQMLGMSALADKILSTKKEYSRGDNKIVIAGLKPWNKTIDGKNQNFAIGVAVSLKTKNQKTTEASGDKEVSTDLEKDFVLDSNPEIAIIELHTGRVAWMKSLDQSTWIDQIKTEMADIL